MKPQRLGAYEVLSVLGTGGTATVFRAKGPDGAVVAIKLLARQDEAALARFAREQTLLAKFGEADGMVPILGHGVAAEGPYIVMPLLEGGTLRARLGESRLPVAEALEVARSLARALSAAHAHGIVHRDVKPENLLYTRRGAEGRLLLGDLGIARHHAAEGPAGSTLGLSRTGEIRGTVGYMPPEQLRSSKSVTPAADVFAAGAVLYECLAGVPAFEGSSIVEVFAKVEAGELKPLRSLRPDVPEWLDAVVARALAPDPEKRFADGAALAQALRAPRRRGLQAHRGLLAFTLGLFVLAVATAATALHLSRTKAVALDEQRARDAVLAARRDLDRGATPKADELDAMVARSPGDALARANRAEALLRRGEEADQVKRALALDPSLGAAWGVQARMLQLAGDEEGAKKSAERALALDPACPTARLVLARRQMRSGMRSEGLRAVGELLARYPGRADVLAVRAAGAIAEGDLPPALRDLEAAVKLDPDLAEASAELERLRGAREQNPAEYAELVELHAALASPEGRTAAAFERRAQLRENDAFYDPPGALEDANQALALAPESPEAWLLRSVARNRLGAWDAAIADATEAIKRRPDDQRTWFARSYAHWKRGALDAAIADANAAIDLGEGTWAWATRGLALAAKGDTAGAYADLKRAARFELRPLELEEEVKNALAKLVPR